MRSLCGKLRNRPRGLRNNSAEALAAVADGRRVDDRQQSPRDAATSSA